MGATKKQIHSQELVELSKLFKALAHPARIAIINRLLEEEDINCKSLQSEIDLAQSTISSHLKVLHDSGILGVKVIKNNAYYKVNVLVLKQVVLYVEKVIKERNLQNDDLRSIYFTPFFKLLKQNIQNYS